MFEKSRKHDNRRYIRKSGIHAKMVIYIIGKFFESIITIIYNNGSKNPLLES